jgi:integrase
MATLVFAGPRIGEAAALWWRDLDLASGRIFVADAKTEAGVRGIDMLPALRDELTAHKANAGKTSPDGLVFPTSNGTKRAKDRRSPARNQPGCQARRPAPRRAGAAAAPGRSDRPRAASHLHVDPIRDRQHGLPAAHTLLSRIWPA